MTKAQAEKWNYETFDTQPAAVAAGKALLTKTGKGNVVYLGAEKLSDAQGYVNNYNVWD